MKNAFQGPNIVQCTPCFSYPYGAVNLLCVPLEIRNLIANSCTRWSEILKGLSQDGRQADFSKKLPRHILLQRPIE